MMLKKRAGALITTGALLGLVALALVGSLAQPTGPLTPGAPQAPVTASDCPPGQVPVAPGARTCIPGGQVARPVAQPASSVDCPPGLVPVAPGSWTCIPDLTVSKPVTEPARSIDCPPGLAPVAPGSRTCIPKSD